MMHALIHHKAIEKLANFSPVMKLAVWAGFVTVIAGLAAGIAALSGRPGDFLEQRLEAIILIATLVGLVVLVITDGRPLSAYGLMMREDWWRWSLGGLLIGISSFAVCILIAGFIGSFSVKSNLSTERWLGLLWTTPEVIGMALTQQIIFAGYILTIFHKRYGRRIAIVVSAVLFTILHRMHEPLFVFQSDQGGLVVGLLLMGILLALLRYKAGNLVFGVCLLAGWVLVERMVSRTRYWPELNESAWMYVLGPGKDPRQAPIVWLTLLGAIVVVSRLRDRSVSNEDVTQRVVATSFKRFFPVEAMHMMAPLDVWLGWLVRARLAIPLMYWLRLLVSLSVSTINTILSLPERMLTPLLLARVNVKAPIFIVGVHRSGTTHLHNLLSKDPQLIAPRNYQVMNPFGWMTTGWLLILPLAGFLPWRRPMDRVRFSMFSPNEEEFALANSCGLSPHGGVMFPKRTAHYDRLIQPEGFTPRQRHRWMRHYRLFLRKLTVWNGRRPVLKNPYNTGRVAMLREMYPQAKFIHIHRHPEAVYRSNIHLQREGHCSLQYQHAEPVQVFRGRFLKNYLAMEQACTDQLAQLPAGRYVEVSFEHLERNPMIVLREIHEHLDLSFTDEYENRLEDYLKTISNYQKNPVSPLPENIQREVIGRLNPLYEKWGYRSERESTRESDAECEITVSARQQATCSTEESGTTGHEIRSMQQKS